MMTWSNEQIEQWRTVQKAYLADSASVDRYKEMDQQRPRVQQEMVSLLQRFLDGTMTVKAFNSLFQQKTNGEWNVFGLKGLSGGMFLNKLVKYIPEEKSLARRLRAWLPVPESADLRYGKRRMQAFARFLEALIVAQEATKSQLQPARVPFLLSAWWHLQDSERWPIFYPIVHAVLMGDREQINTSEDPIEAYFTFRECFLSLAKILGLSQWELEHLCTWYGQQHLDEHNVSRDKALSLSVQRRKSLFSQELTALQALLPFANTPYSPLQLSAEEGLLHKQEQESSCHTHLQWLLAKIGHKVGCGVWIAINDHSKVWKRERLGDLSLKSLPILAGSEYQRIVSRIDVLWFQQERVVAAYEIEHTTDISTGLLRLYDLGMLCAEQDVSLCVVTPNDRLRKVQFELSRPLFDGHALRKFCTLIAEETLLLHEEHILRWAGSLSVIPSLTYHFAGEDGRGVRV